MSHPQPFTMTVPLTDPTTGQGLDDVEVLAYPTDTPGLVVHRQPADPTCWVVTHAPSGATISARGWPNQPAALRFAAKLGPVTDWTRNAQHLRTHPDVTRLRMLCLQAELAVCDQLGIAF